METLPKSMKLYVSSLTQKFTPTLDTIYCGEISDAIFNVYNASQIFIHEVELTRNIHNNEFITCHQWGAALSKPEFPLISYVNSNGKVLLYPHTEMYRILDVNVISYKVTYSYNIDDIREALTKIFKSSTTKTLRDRMITYIDDRKEYNIIYIEPRNRYLNTKYVADITIAFQS